MVWGGGGKSDTFDLCNRLWDGLLALFKMAVLLGKPAISVWHEGTSKILH